eukprot:7317820-Prymnesium_polylepis.1
MERSSTFPRLGIPTFMVDGLNPPRETGLVPLRRPDRRGCRPFRDSWRLLLRFIPTDTPPALRQYRNMDLELSKS